MFDNGLMPKNKKDDRRSTRTRVALRHSLIQLIQEKHFDEITVQDIIDRANVGRSTFYAHFRDKEDLLFGDWTRFLEGIVQHIDWANAGKNRFVPIREFFIHLKDVHPFYRALVKSSKIERMFKTGVEYLSQGIEKSLTQFLTDQPQPSIPVPILANHLASTIFEQLKWWLDNNMPYPPERMDEIFHALVSPNFQFLAEENEKIENRQVFNHGHASHFAKFHG